MSKIEKAQEMNGIETVTLTEDDLTITGRGRHAGQSPLFIAALALPAPKDGQYAAVKTGNVKTSTVNNCVQALNRAGSARFASRSRGQYIVRIS
jgi:predicted RNA methylase